MGIGTLKGAIQQYRKDEILKELIGLLGVDEKAQGILKQQKLLKDQVGAYDAQMRARGHSALFRDIEDRRNAEGHGLLDVWMSHGDRVDALPPGFVGERHLRLQGAGEGVGGIGERAQSQPPQHLPVRRLGLPDLHVAASSDVVTAAS